MTIRDLEIFIEVVKTKNMSEAAKNLSISQPTVSHAISQIENEYSVRLFDRISKKLYITDVGLRLYHYAMDLLEQFEDIVLFLQGSSKKYAVTLGVSAAFGSNFLLQLIEEFEANHSDIDIRTYVDERKNIVDKIEQGLVDLGIIESDVILTNSKSLDEYHDEMVLVVSKNHKFAKAGKVTLQELKGERFVLGELDEETKKSFLNQLRKEQVPIDLKWICQNNDMMLNIIQSGNAISLGSKQFLQAEKDVVLVPIQDITIERHYKLISHNDKFLNDDLTDFVNYVHIKFNKE